MVGVFSDKGVNPTVLDTIREQAQETKTELTSESEIGQSE